MDNDGPKPEAGGDGSARQSQSQPQDVQDQEQPHAGEQHAVTVDKIDATNSIIVVAEKAGIEGLTQIARGLWRGDVGGEGAIRDIAKEFADAMKATLLGSLTREPDEPKQPRPDHMPETDGDIEQWFCGSLDDRGRCAVRAAAILHGAPAHEVNRARDELYDVLYPDGQRHEAATGPSPSSLRALLADTFMETRRSGGTSRLFWQDAESNGYSAFGLGVLRLIAGEIEGTRGMAGQNVLPTLERWATERPESMPETERTWRTARSLGVIWWTLDHARLRATARTWAANSSMLEQHSASGLLYGAYEIEQNEISPGIAAADKPVTPELLRMLSDEALFASTVRESERLARVVTSTYGLIGRRWPDAALDGLDYLLCLTPTDRHERNTALSFPVFVHGALSYVALAWDGHVRQVLARLAEHVERHVHSPRDLSQGRDAAQARTVRQQSQAVAFFIFFLLAASSLVGVEEKKDISYSCEATLPARPAIPDEHGHDVLLAGIVSNTELLLRIHLSTILCGALVSGRAALAGGTMRRWADVLARLAEPGSRAPRQAYVRFLTSIGRLAREWDSDLDLTGGNAAFAQYENQLAHWKGDERVTELAEMALGRLGGHLH